MTVLLLYLSQEGEMLNNQMSALCFPRTALPTDDDTLKQRETNLVTKSSKKYLDYSHFPFINQDRLGHLADTALDDPTH